MVWRHDVLVPQQWWNKCHQWGEDLTAHYARGGSPNSLAVSSHGAEMDPVLQASAKLGECAFCAWADLDALTAVKWDLVPDGGFDAVWNGLRPDIKSTQHHNARYLIWPVRKTKFFDTKQFDILVLVEASIFSSACTLRGWVTKADFRRDRLIAQEGDGTCLTPDTRYMLASGLASMNDLLPKRQPLGGDHLCHCGQYGSRSSDGGAHWHCMAHDPNPPRIEA